LQLAKISRVLRAERSGSEMHSRASRTRLSTRIAVLNQKVGMQTGINLCSGDRNGKGGGGAEEPRRRKRGKSEKGGWNGVKLDRAGFTDLVEAGRLGGSP